MSHSRIVPWTVVTESKLTGIDLVLFIVRDGIKNVPTGSRKSDQPEGRITEILELLTRLLEVLFLVIPFSESSQVDKISFKLHPNS